MSAARKVKPSRFPWHFHNSLYKKLHNVCASSLGTGLAPMLSRFWKSEDGNYAVIFTIAILPIMAGVGGSGRLRWYQQ